MKKLIKTILVLFVCTLSNILLAQTKEDQTMADQTIGLKVGLQLTDMIFINETGEKSESFGWRFGGLLGVTAEFPINTDFSFETGLLLVQKGYKREYTTSFSQGNNATLRLNLIYVDIPLLAKGYYSVRNNKIFGTVGPNLGLGLFGKSKTERTGTSQNTNEEHVIEWGSDKDEDYLKRLDLGLSVGAGIQVSDLEIGLNCQISLFNVSSFVNDGDKIRNRILALTLAYKFNQ